jgi:hypothetical protein
MTGPVGGNRKKRSKNIIDRFSKALCPWFGGGAVGGPDERPQARRAEDVDRGVPERQDPRTMGTKLSRNDLHQTSTKEGEPGKEDS